MARLEREALAERLIRKLGISGPMYSRELRDALAVSQPTLSRLVASLRERLLIVGHARATRYAARRTLAGVGDRVPIYEVDETGRTRELAELHATHPEGFYLESRSDTVESKFADDLPYFLHDLRPAGFLGRLIPTRHPELELPADVRHWSAAHTLAYLTRYGWNPSGNLIVGDDALRLYLENTRSPPDLIRARDRKRRYPELARNVLLAGAPGSSAGGEQPKFLVTKAPENAPVLVKFSPPLDDALGRRAADLLIAEHVAHRVLSEHGCPAATSVLVETKERLFLEVERFDRTPGGGRKGLISCFALDAEFVGRLLSWSDSARFLEQRGIIDAATLRRVRFLEQFGLLIANSDRHLANLSFFTRGTRVLGLAPVYDMLPMRYASVHGHVAEPGPRLEVPDPSEADVWSEACPIALEYWSRVASHPRISKDFQHIAERHIGVLRGWNEIARRLPKPTPS